MFGPAKMGTGIQTKTPGYRPGGSEVKFGNCNAVIQPFDKSPDQFTFEHLPD